MKEVEEINSMPLTTSGYNDAVKKNNQKIDDYLKKKPKKPNRTYIEEVSLK